MHTISDEDHFLLDYFANDSYTSDLAERIHTTKFEDRAKLSFTDLEILAAGVLYQQQEIRKILARTEKVVPKKSIIRRLIRK